MLEMEPGKDCLDGLGKGCRVADEGEETAALRSTDLKRKIRGERAGTLVLTLRRKDQPDRASG